MFNDMMDQFDEICQNDMPVTPSQDWRMYCKLLYTNGELLVELYLHGYEDYEICTRIYACPRHFFENA